MSHVRCSGAGPRLLVLLLLFAAAIPRLATAQQTDVHSRLIGLAAGERQDRIATLNELARSRDGRLVAFLESFQQGAIYVHRERVVLCEEFQTIDGRELAPLSDPLTRQPLVNENQQPLRVESSQLQSIGPSGRERRLVGDAIRALEVWSPDQETRLAAIQKLGDSRNAEYLEPLREVVEADGPAVVTRKARESLAMIELGSEALAGDHPRRLAAARQLGELASARALGILQDLLKEPEKLSDDERLAFQQAADAIESYQSRIGHVQNLFFGLSLGSVLILIALGLAIIFGQMGVINMAHGEMMMVGAYATYETQRLFGHTPGDPANWFFLVALPVSFFSAALVGWLIERLVVRHLYGRPLDTLLATWGVGLILIQAARVKYGDNIGVNSPTWLVGSFEPIQDLRISYNRIFILALCGVCVLTVYALMNYTRRGLLIRATVQNRETAESLGVNTRRTDGFTFALGAGLAGIAGYAWTLIGGVTPDMGQNHIVDAFLVVVTGGVGELAGAVWAGLSLGMINKFIEPWLGSAIWAKVILLLLVIGFIQWKPAGLFPPKGRMADV